MAHVRLEYSVEVVDQREMCVVEVYAGPAPRAIRPVGTLRLHAAELNGLDRLLTRGAVFETPASTYELRRGDFGDESQEVAAVAQTIRRRLTGTRR